MKFAHLSDLHIGGWRDRRMQQVSMQAFQKAMDVCVEEKVDFILFAGDLFNTALPEVEKLAAVAGRLRKIKEKGIPVYVIPGSHDFSASGKTMIDVLENAGVLVNVCKGEVIEKKIKLSFTIDQKTGAKITGVMGKRGMLDRKFYEDLDREILEKESGYKIFMFHTTIDELKPKHLEQMDSQPVTLLPKGFDYYAGGHVHHRMEFSAEGYNKVTQPGALFPNNFAEIEKYGHGGFFIVDNGKVEWNEVKIKERAAFAIDCADKAPEDIVKDSVEKLGKENLNDSIVALRFEGKLANGGLADIDFKEILSHAYYKGAFSVLKNVSGVSSREFEEIEIKDESIEDIENVVIREHSSQFDFEKGIFEEEIDAAALTKELMHALSVEKQDGENARDFEQRVKKGAFAVLKLDAANSSKEL